MPEICRFLGIAIYIYYRDHSPPHFHAVYNQYEIKIELETGIIEGTFPRHALKAVLEWYELHRDELHEDWELATARSPLKKITPLE
ncbi:MAG: DUF4160 domain-containing protein [Brevinematales bacterium]|nr:DUF4160 domain-containing protein [Brevinematales bacterium]